VPQDQGRYDFLAQVEKLERITMGRRNICGIVVLLTNDHLHWTEPMQSNTVDCEFRIHENRIVTGELKWQEHASTGTKEKRDVPIFIKGRYQLKWHHYSTVNRDGHGEFRYIYNREK